MPQVNGITERRFLGLVAKGVILFALVRLTIGLTDEGPVAYGAAFAIAVTALDFLFFGRLEGWVTRIRAARKSGVG